MVVQTNERETPSPPVVTYEFLAEACEGFDSEGVYIKCFKDPLIKERSFHILEVNVYNQVAVVHARVGVLTKARLKKDREPFVYVWLTCVRARIEDRLMLGVRLIGPDVSEVYEPICIGKEHYKAIERRIAALCKDVREHKTTINGSYHDDATWSWEY